MEVEPTGPNPRRLGWPTPEEMNDAWHYFWSRDEIRGYENGKRVGTGIPRKWDGHQMVRSETLSGDFPEESAERPHGGL
tara:strand:- start:6591 stop:6827 length:237 start_codon:yes stop_codon:yes gene_type:complete